MHTRKRTWSTNRPWRTSLLKCMLVMIIVLFSSFHCEAQCSIPPAIFQASMETQSVYSPHYPDLYPDDLSCSWLINSPIDTGRIQLRVVQYDFSGPCDKDYLLIKDGENSTARSIAILCFELNPVTITSSGPALYGEFRSDADGNAGFGYTLEFDYFDSKVACPTGWIGRQGYCYKLYNEPLPWQQAASRCGYDGGYLTSIVDEKENNFLVGSFQGQSSSAWIGMDSIGNWLDGSSSLIYDNFVDESPSVTQCSVLNFDGNGYWHVSDCLTQRLNFVCKKTQDGSGGRYWTEVSTGDDGKGTPLSAYFIASIIIFSIFFIWFVCLSGSRNPKEWLITKLLTSLRDAICECLGTAGQAVGGCLSCRCVERNHQPRRGGTSPNIRASRESAFYEIDLNEVDLSRRTSSESGDRSRGMSAISQSPPTYGDVTSEPPPPSYVDALDPSFAVSHTDVRGSRISVNIGDSIPAPSYESVVGSETNI